MNSVVENQEEQAVTNMVLNLLLFHPTITLYAG